MGCTPDGVIPRGAKWRANDVQPLQGWTVYADDSGGGTLVVLHIFWIDLGFWTKSVPAKSEVMGSL